MFAAGIRKLPIWCGVQESAAPLFRPILSHRGKAWQIFGNRFLKQAFILDYAYRTFQCWDSEAKLKPMYTVLSSDLVLRQIMQKKFCTSVTALKLSKISTAICWTQMMCLRKAEINLFAMFQRLEWEPTYRWWKLFIYRRRKGRVLSQRADGGKVFSPLVWRTGAY